MGRTEYFRDPQAPKPNTLIPASNLLVVNEEAEILLQRRRDTGQWALPGGAQEMGETPAECAVRECEEETGVKAAISGFLGVFSDPDHIVAYTDGEIRQEYEVTLIGQPVSGVPTVNDEASDVRWVHPGGLDDLDIHPTQRRQIDLYLSGRYPHVD
jgi:8-oxo-dGTP pyrophosphatase MutT (NUDIX family)